MNALHFSHRFTLTCLAMWLVPNLTAQEPKKSDIDDLLEAAGKGTHFLLVPHNQPNKNLADRLFWRKQFSDISASTTPVRFRCGDVDVIAPVLAKADQAEDESGNIYPIDSYGKVPNGKHLLMPGAIPIEFEGGNAKSKHPAIQVDGNEVRIRCAPVRLEVLDEQGAPVPSAIKVFNDKGSLLRKEARFRVLIVWLPIGAEYRSSLGAFSLTASGKVEARPDQLAPGVKVTAEGLRKLEPVAPTLPANPVPDSVLLPLVQAKVENAGVALFVLPVVEPQQAVWVAVSKRQVREVTGKEFRPEDLRCRLGGAIEERPLVVQVDSTGNDSQRSAASRALNTTTDDLVGMSIALPPSATGPTPLRFSMDATRSAGVAVVVASKSALQLIPHRWRTVFAQPENGIYSVLIPKGTKATTARIVLQGGPLGKDKPVDLGEVSLPSVEEGTDSRLFSVAMSHLPPGKYQLGLESSAGSSGKIPLTIVSWQQRSPFLVQSMSGCTACWPTSDEGLDLLEKSGLEMLSATGFASQLDTHMPHVDAALAASLRQRGLPPELAVRPTENDRLLQRLLEHRLRLIDLAVLRGAGFYTEGLSYHHSYQPSVDRMVRRMQLFTQQTADYPSFWGVNYSWFPNLFGYSEGGVPTDAHVGDRNRVLLEAVEKTGHKPLTKTELGWFNKNKLSENPEDREKALQLLKRAVEYRQVVQDLGWAKHNKLYDDAIREIRPETVFTLFENAGHDEGKRLRSMYHDLTAQCYESYTDFGDWPMSSPFVVDWSRGQTPGKPVWLTTCWGTSSEGKMKSLFHSFARGLSGGGVPMEATFELKELAHRGTGMEFLGRYGALTSHAVPDRRVAILHRGASAVFGRGLWDAHATYYHLTRLGYPPIVLSDEDIGSGIPEHVKVLVLVKEQTPLEHGSRKAIENFQKRGGKVVALGCQEKIPDAIVVAEGPQHLWEVGGFTAEGHQKMWQAFQKNWRPVLTDVMAKTGLPVLAQVDPELGIAVTLDAGPVRYVAVIADAKNTHSNAFEPIPALPISLEGTGWQVRDLVKGRNLPTTTKGNRTETVVELQTEPTALLALYHSVPVGVDVESTADVRLGEDLKFKAEVRGADGANLGHVPIEITLIGPDQSVREKLYRAAGEMVTFNTLPLKDVSGTYHLRVKELLTGIALWGDLPIAPAKEPGATAVGIEQVHVVNRDHLNRWVSRIEEKLVIVEPGQTALIPMATKLVENLKAKGVAVRLWIVKPEEYEAHPVRWYPRPADEKRLKEIEAGHLIGIRENLQPFVDKIKRVHVPEKGGYAEIEPVYMVGRDCIVFSGGPLAESLRAVTPWMQTPSIPGHGQGRLVVCFSPFMANRQVLAVVGNDLQGLKVATDHLVSNWSSEKKIPPQQPVARKLQPMMGNVAADDLSNNYAGYSPMQRVERLLASPDGRAVVVLRGRNDNLAFVDAEGKVVATSWLDPALQRYARLDDRSQLHWPVQINKELHPGWHFPTKVEIRDRCLSSDGKVAYELPLYLGAPDVPDYVGGLLTAPDGQTLALGRPGGLLFSRSDTKEVRRFDDVANASTRFSLLYPRQPVGAAFSPDSRYVVFTMDSRPPFGGLGSPTPKPTAPETVLLDLQSSKTIWRLSGSNPNRSTYAVHSGFAAVSRGATRTALMDYDGGLVVVDSSGKILFTETIKPTGPDSDGRMGPADGVGTWLSDGGETAVFGFKSQFVVVRGNQSSHISAPGLTSLALSKDGNRIVAGLASGKIDAYDPRGKLLWTATPGGTAPHVALLDGGRVLAALGTGELVLLDAEGKESRRTNVIEKADQARHEVKPASDVVQRPRWQEYVEPNTLGLAQKLLKAEKIESLKLAGAAHTLCGRSFSSLPPRTELTAKEDGDYFLHFVYRRPENNKTLRIVAESKEGKEAFFLDLPTPEYRVVDIPVRGPGVRVTIESDGPAESAEISLWKFKWPGQNLAYVKPLNSGDADKPLAKGGDDILEELGGKSTLSGKLKNCRLWWSNTDPDAVRGAWVPVPVDPIQMVDGKRFGNGRGGMWSNFNGNFPPTRGGFMTIDFGETIEPGLVATYDRAGKQSEVCVNLCVFGPDPTDELRGGRMYGGVVGSDQFWRLIPTSKPALKVLGIHVIRDGEHGSGLSEVEVYP